MKTSAPMKRALKICVPLFFSVAITFSAVTVAQAQGYASAIPELEEAYNRVQEATMAMKQAETQSNSRAMERALNNYSRANQNMRQYGRCHCYAKSRYGLGADRRGTGT